MTAVIQDDSPRLTSYFFPHLDASTHRRIGASTYQRSGLVIHQNEQANNGVQGNDGGKADHDNSFENSAALAR